MSETLEHDVARRIVPCLDVREGQVVKGVQFRDHRVMGDIIELAARYRDAGADELVFYDITASPEGRSVDTERVRRVSETIDIPFCVAGGIRSVASAARVLAQGADKISINTPALENPELIDAMVQAFVSQCVVIGVDSIADDGDYTVRSHTGTPDRMRTPGRRTLDWLREVVDRGAGEVVLNCMSADGTRAGYDIAQLTAARAVLRSVSDSPTSTQAAGSPPARRAASKSGSGSGFRTASVSAPMSEDAVRNLLGLLAVALDVREVEDVAAGQAGGPVEDLDRGRDAALVEAVDPVLPCAAGGQEEDRDAAAGGTDPIESAGTATPPGHRSAAARNDRRGFDKQFMRHIRFHVS